MLSDGTRPDRAYRRPCWNWAGMRRASSMPRNCSDHSGRSVIDGGLRLEGDQVEQVVGGQAGEPAFTAADRRAGERPLLGHDGVDALLDSTGADEGVDL